MSSRRLVWLLVLIAGCVAPPDPGLRRPRWASAPADIDRQDLEITGAGVALYAQRWRPVGAEPKAVVVIHHGFADHSARYAELAARLVRAGYAVWALDMRGHGRSTGARATVDRFDHYLDDLDAFLARVRAEEPGRPLFLYGHSAGGLISSLYTIERQPALAGLVLVAPALAFDVPPIQAAGIGVLAAVAPNAPAIDPSHEAFSRRAEVVAEMDADPLIFQRKGPVRTARSVIDGAARVWAAPERLRVPLLVLHGTADPLTAPAGSRDLVARAGAADRTLRLYDGLVHDLLRESGGAGGRVAGEIVAWLDAHTGGPAVTFTSSPPQRLRGDRGARATSIELDVRGERSEADDVGATAGLRVRFGAGRATALGLGYYGGLDLRGGYLAGGQVEADAHLAGLALRTGGGALLAFTGGVGAGGPRGVTATRAPVELGAELPLGPTRLLARAGAAWRLGGDRYDGDALGIADEVGALVGVRLGRDRRYWGDLTAGAGPHLALVYRNLGGAAWLGVAVGVDLWGGD